MGFKHGLLAPFFLVALAACTPQFVLPGPDVTEPALHETAIQTADGEALPLESWQPKGEPRAVLLALHGFNDYRGFIRDPAPYFAGRGISVYAYDQRGFGDAPNRGRWPGREALINDARTAIQLLRKRHPDKPVFLLGFSMGGAVSLATMTSDNRPAVDGVILAAPAVWGRKTMSFIPKTALWLASHTVPWLKLTGQGLAIRASDNDEGLRAMGRDPAVIKATRVDSMNGLVNLMDLALDSASKFDSRALILYGDKDRIIQKDPTDLMLSTLPEEAKTRQRLVRYPDGWHMLLLDRQREKVWRDIAAWISNPDAPLPSETEAARTKPES
ncbi:MAG: lysophospholipase [Proteobacteria bacterium]|nr:lysophospholipase [Pseudomonadota bacterium]